MAIKFRGRKTPKKTYRPNGQVGPTKSKTKSKTTKTARTKRPTLTTTTTKRTTYGIAGGGTAKAAGSKAMALARSYNKSFKKSLTGGQTSVSWKTPSSRPKSGAGTGKFKGSKAVGKKIYSAWKKSLPKGLIK